MKRFVALAVVAGFVATMMLCSSASALPPFKKAFEEKYPDLKDQAEKASCGICHVKDKPKTMRNAYGIAIAKEIDPDGKYKAAGDDKDAKKAVTLDLVKKLTDGGFDAVAKAKAPGGQTFGDAISGGKLP